MGIFEDVNDIFLNLAYLLALTAFLIREVFWLRLALVLSQAAFVIYALRADNFSMTVWNAGFILINGYQVVRILRQRRPIELPGPLEEIYRKSFRLMNRREFLYFWRTGREEEREDGCIVREGERQQSLYLVLEGTAAISRDGEEVARVGRGDFLADSCDFISPGPSPIDARARGRIALRRWDYPVLEDIRKIDPALMLKIQKIVSGYLTAKLRAALDET
ncbi:MAG: cyclic nucleotide-binding domain-containing protein [Candidatus Erginobacter occultus]|nr:cyclic nucleotide-binding domain-containing protein [Candidatus Erginobacter occultus]